MTTCSDTNPWDSRITCILAIGHVGRHENRPGYDIHRWADYCHYPNDACGPGSHRETRNNTGSE